MYIKIFEFRRNTTFDKSLDKLALDEMSLDELGMNRSLMKRRRDLNLGVLTNLATGGLAFIRRHSLIPMGINHRQWA